MLLHELAGLHQHRGHFPWPRSHCGCKMLPMVAGVLGPGDVAAERYWEADQEGSREAKEACGLSRKSLAVRFCCKGSKKKR